MTTNETPTERTTPPTQQPIGMRSADELVQDWYKAHGSHLINFIRRIQSDAYETGKRDAVPDGCVLVPIKQTEDIWKKVFNAAAPQPPTGK